MISFAITKQQIRDRSKTVTRRLGWSWLQPGMILTGVEKAMGLKKGEKIKRLCLIKVLSVRLEKLGAITPADVVREGFPEMGPNQFVDMFSRSHGGCSGETIVTRIEYGYIVGGRLDEQEDVHAVGAQRDQPPIVSGHARALF